MDLSSVAKMLNPWAKVRLRTNSQTPWIGPLCKTSRNTSTRSLSTPGPTSKGLHTLLALRIQIRRSRRLVTLARGCKGIRKGDGRGGEESEWKERRVCLHMSIIKCGMVGGSGGVMALHFMTLSQPNYNESRPKPSWALLSFDIHPFESSHCLLEPMLPSSYLDRKLQKPFALSLCSIFKIPQRTSPMYRDKSSSLLEPLPVKSRHKAGLDCRELRCVIYTTYPSIITINTYFFPQPHHRIFHHLLPHTK